MADGAYVHMSALGQFKKIGNFFHFDFWSFVIFYIVISSLVLYVFYRYKNVKEDSRTVVVQTEAPDISPMYSHFLSVSGREGGIAGDISRLGSQFIMILELFEVNALKTLEWKEDKYFFEVNQAYAENRYLKPEEKEFLDLITTKIGFQGTLTEIISSDKDGRSGLGGFQEIDDIWFDFWQTYLPKKSIEDGYFKKPTLIATLYSYFSLSMTLGAFFSFILIFIPYIGIVIAGILMLPLVLLLFISLGIEKIISLVYKLPEIDTFMNAETVPPLVFSIFFFSWFFWFGCLGLCMKIAFTPVTNKALDLFLYTKGYKLFLSTVDKDRLSFQDRESGALQSKTTFAWLLIFKQIKKDHLNELLRQRSQV